MGCIYTIILVPRRNVYVLFECWDCFQSTKPSSAIFRLCCCLGDAEICRLSCPGDSVLTAVLVIFHVMFVGWSCSALRSGPAASHKQPSRSLDHQPKKHTRNKVKIGFNAKKQRDIAREFILDSNLPCRNWIIHNSPYPRHPTNSFALLLFKCHTVAHPSILKIGTHHSALKFSKSKRK